MTENAGVTLPSKVDPARLTSILEDAGWQQLGGRRGLYVRLAPPGESTSASSASLIIPLDDSAPEFSDVMRSALVQISRNRELWSRSIYPRLAVAASDEFRFRKESSAPSGLIQWRNGEKLIESARRTLLAGAKYFMGPGRHFVNKYGRFAGRYLDEVLMGQTAPGSYIVTAYAPPYAPVALKTGGSEASTPIAEVGTAHVREVNEAVVRAVSATVEALQHYKSSGSLSGFEDGVARGISYEMTNAILGIASQSEEADLTVEWDADTPLSHPVESHFEFRGDDVEPLSRAAIKLAEDTSTQHVTIVGRVHLLAKKQAGSPGVFGIDSLQSQGPRKVRVRLADEEDYHEAVRAHEEDLALQVSGRLEKEGNLSWLYDAIVVRTMGHLDEYIVKRSGVSPNQMNLFSSD